MASLTDPKRLQPEVVNIIDGAVSGRAGHDGNEPGSAENTETGLTPQVGDIYRDLYRYRDDPAFWLRSVRVTAVANGRVEVVSVTNIDGTPVEKPRRSSMKLATLASGYALLDRPEAAPAPSHQGRAQP